MTASSVRAAVGSPTPGAHAAGDRALGGALLVQLAGMIVPFVLLVPVAGASRNGMDEVTRAAPQVRLAVLLLFANGALTVGISVVSLRRWRPHGEGMAMALVAASVAMLATQAVDNAHVMSLLALSRQLAGGSGAGMRDALAVAGVTRGWTHATAILAIDAWMALFHLGLYRLRLVPRGVAAFTLATVVLHATSIPGRAFAELAPLGMLGAPMALGHLLTATWVLVNGLTRR